MLVTCLSRRLINSRGSGTNISSARGGFHSRIFEYCNSILPRDTGLEYNEGSQFIWRWWSWLSFKGMPHHCSRDIVDVAFLFNWLVGLLLFLVCSDIRLYLFSYLSIVLLYAFALLQQYWKIVECRWTVQIRWADKKIKKWILRSGVTLSIASYPASHVD